MYCWIYSDAFVGEYDLCLTLAGGIEFTKSWVCCLEYLWNLRLPHKFSVRDMKIEMLLHGCHEHNIVLEPFSIKVLLEQFVSLTEVSLAHTAASLRRCASEELIPTYEDRMVQ